MPARIDKEQAVQRLAESVPTGTCSMCHVLGAREPLAETERAALVLNRFPLRWGHLLVVARRHVTSFDALDGADHADASALVFRAARALERTMKPVRVFTASLGTARTDVPMSSPHLHWHVIPVTELGERPSEVLTWSNGVLEGTTDEWDELRASIERELG